MVAIGARSVVMENALVRGRDTHPVKLGDDVLAGPHAHVNGSEVGDGCFLATGTALFPGSRLGRGVEVRINGVIHVNTVLNDGARSRSAGWPWATQRGSSRLGPRRDLAHPQGLDFPKTVYGLPRDASARERMEHQTEWFGAHRDDRILD